MPKRTCFLDTRLDQQLERLNEKIARSDAVRPWVDVYCPFLVTTQPARL
jgi:hypothetical protein